MLQNFALCFFPLFVAMDPPLAVPFFASMTSNAQPAQRKRIAKEAVVAAFTVGCLFLIAGKALFGAVGITENDFRIGGGLILLVSSVGQFGFAQKKTESAATSESINGATPLGVPLIMGPASITTLVILAKSYGSGSVFFAILLNLAIVWAALHFSAPLTRRVGPQTMSILSKMAALVLVSIAVMMIRVGATNISAH